MYNTIAALARLSFCGSGRCRWSTRWPRSSSARARCSHSGGVLLGDVFARVDAVHEERDKSSTRPSYCHPWADGVTHWLTLPHSLAGITPLEPGNPGFHMVRARPARLSHISVSYRKSALYGAFVWATRALSSDGDLRRGQYATLPHVSRRAPTVSATHQSLDLSPTCVWGRGSPKCSLNWPMGAMQ